MLDPRLLAAGDDDAWLVYADELQAAGDPRGELIVIQHRLRATPDDVPLRGRQQELLAEHAEYLLGPARGARPFTNGEHTRGIEVDWRHGFARRVSLRDDAPDLGQVLVHPSFQLLESLWLAEPEPGRNQHYAAHYVRPIVDTGPHESLRELVIGPHIERSPEWAGPGYVFIDVDISAQHLGDLGALWKAVPALERLAVIGNHVELGTLTLPRLRTFEHITSSLGRSELAAIRGATWPRLERLEIWFGDGEYGGGDCTVADVRELLAQLPARTPALRELGIANCPFVSELVPLLDCEAVRRVRRLDLSHGNLSKKAIAALAKLVVAWPTLEELNVAASPCDERALGRLRSAAPHVTILAGRLAPGRRRYTALSE